MGSDSKNERDLFRIMVYASSLGCGVMASFLYSLKDVRHDPTLLFSKGTVIAFVLGATACWVFWWLVKYLIRKKGIVRDERE